MKVAIFNWRDIKNPAAGGAEIATHQIAKRLVKAGNEVIQFSARFKNSKKTEVVGGVKIFRAGNPFSVHFLAFFFYQKNLAGKVDVVVDQIHGLPFFTPIYVKVPKIAYIHEVAGPIWFWEWPFPVNILGFIAEKLYFFLYKKILFITVSQSSKKDLINYGISQKLITVIQNGLNPPSLSKNFRKEKFPVIIYLGRIYRAKRIEEIIIAFKIVQQKYPNSRLWIVGTGKIYYRNYLKNLARKLNLAKKISFYEFVNENKKYQLLKKSWIICGTSVKEGWGLTITEAASVGTPAVVYNVGGLKDVVISAKTGIICQKNTPEILAQNLIKLISDNNLRMKFGRNAQNFVKSLNWEKTTKEFLKVVNQVIKAS